MQSRILVVEDDPTVLETIDLVLRRDGFGVTAVRDGRTAVVEATRHAAHDLVLLDLMLPDLSGLDVCREVRRTSNIPIVMVTARASAADVVAGLELGADDYVTKPFNPSELTARVRAVLRRATPSLTSDGVLQVRDLVVDEAAFRASRGSQDVSLTATEFRILHELAQRAGAVLTRDVLLERIWGYDYLGDSRLVDMAILRLREKLGTPLSGPPYITTVRGVGYRFERE